MSNLKTQLNAKKTRYDRKESKREGAKKYKKKNFVLKEENERK
jgi:hypothetical protein